MAEIIWSNTALNDLKVIGSFIAQDSEYYARIVVQKIYNSVQRLAPFPESGKMIPEFLNHNYREIIVKPYRVFYLFENEKVNILTIVHSKENV